MFTRSLRDTLLLCAFVVSASTSVPAVAESVSTLRVMLNPAMAPKGTLPDAARARLERLAGTALTFAGSTRTGALELVLPAPREASDVALMLRNLRNDRAVLWAEVPARLAKASPLHKSTSQAPSRKLMVRLKDDGADVTPLLADFAVRLGSPVAIERKVGEVWVLSLLQARSVDEVAAMAATLQDHPDVQYADPVRWAQPQRVPNDPMLDQQWGLTDAVAGINAPAAWTLDTGSPSITIAVVDTGILPHPDLAGRVLPGFDFISNPDDARDGDGRDPNPRDEGDWRDDGDCGGAPAESSSWHGTFVAGLIGANADNGIGIAGVDWNAKILPVRVLGRCGGTFDDILAGMLWASGVQVAGVPPNPTPAKVINMSLGGEGPCDQAIQEAVDDALAQGSIVVVAAGNSTADATGFNPASCGGVITVGALARSGDRASYSNFGQRVDISAPGGDFTHLGLILSLSNDGVTTPGAPSYDSAAGTSAAAPLVTGAAALMLARNPLLTAGRALGIMQGTARDFPISSTCGVGGACGTGILDLGLTIASTLPASSTPPPGAVPVVEYYRADLDHYFMTATPLEMDYIDQQLSDIFARTGLFFYAYASPFATTAQVSPVCRFYGAGLIQSHYYTANASECQFIQANYPGVWNLESGAAFYVQVPDFLGNCPDGTLPVYRFFNNRSDANHRYTLDLSIRRAMINRQWVPEGNGPNGVVFCSPY